jgi:hypothetical protein
MTGIGVLLALRRARPVLAAVAPPSPRLPICPDPKLLASDRPVRADDLIQAAAYFLKVAASTSGMLADERAEAEAPRERAAIAAVARARAVALTDRSSGCAARRLRGKHAPRLDADAACRGNGRHVGTLVDGAVSLRLVVEPCRLTFGERLALSSSEHTRRHFALLRLQLLREQGPEQFGLSRDAADGGGVSLACVCARSCPASGSASCVSRHLRSPFKRALLQCAMWRRRDFSRSGKNRPPVNVEYVPQDLF